MQAHKPTHIHIPNHIFPNFIIRYLGRREIYLRDHLYGMSLSGLTWPILNIIFTNTTINMVKVSFGRVGTIDITLYCDKHTGLLPSVYLQLTAIRLDSTSIDRYNFKYHYSHNYWQRLVDRHFARHAPL
jgi:hypothetical protein